MAHELIFVTPDLGTELPLPYVDEGVRAGFPSPAQDYVGENLDLNRDLVMHPAATFYARVVGDSMSPEIQAGDILMVDRSLQPTDGCIAVCCLNNEFNVKRLDLSSRSQGIIRLISANPSFPTIEVSEDETFEVWGVVSYIIHKA